MAIPLTDGTAHSLRAYLREVKATNSEIGKRERFASLLGTLFPNQREVGIYTGGAETSLRIKTPEKDKTGRADTIFGSAVVEFEKDLKKTLSEPSASSANTSPASGNASRCRAATWTPWRQMEFVGESIVPSCRKTRI
jgi:hypothetical protein